MHHSKNWKYPR